MQLLKKALPVICVFCLCIFGGTAYALGDGIFDNYIDTTSKGILHTIITDTDGDTHYLDGVFTAEELENSGAAVAIASYSVYKGETELYKTELRDISAGGASLFGIYNRLNGYYTLEFKLSDNDNTQGFLTGLSSDQHSELENTIIENAKKGEDVSITDASFIDAEKKDNDSGADDNLCWAAATSNILYYTGWADQTKDFGAYDEDDIFEVFIENFYDGGGNAGYGLPWFFDGHYPPQGKNTDGETWAQLKEEAKTDGYLNDYDVHQLMEDINVSEGDNYKNIAYVLAKMKEGYGVELGIGWNDAEGNRHGGHAVTVWGYIIDEDYGISDKRHYKALVIADSDSKKTERDNRRNAPNELNVKNLGPYNNGIYNSWETTNYTSIVKEGSGDIDVVGVLNDFVILKPYDDSLTKESDIKNESKRGTKDRHNTVDFLAEIAVGTPIFELDKQGNEVIANIEPIGAFNHQQPAGVRFFLKNESDIGYNGYLYYEIKIEKENENDKKEYETVDTKRYIAQNLESSYGELPLVRYSWGCFELPDSLEKGHYRATITLDPEVEDIPDEYISYLKKYYGIDYANIPEAYEYNNTASVEFTIYDENEICRIHDGKDLNKGKKVVCVHYIGDDSAKVIIAGYDDKDIIQTIKTADNIDKGNNDVVLTDELLACDYIKVLMCNGDGNMFPLCESKIFEKAEYSN